MSIESIAAAGTRIVPGRLLRSALRLDAAVSAAAGVAYVAAVGPLSSWLELPDALLIAAGAVLVVWGAALAYLAQRPAIAPAAVWTVIALNAAWVADSLLLLAVDGFSPSVAGQVGIAFQAVGVVGFAALQYLGLRRYS
jgi:hypothetical protein